MTNLRVAEVKKANVESLSESQAKKALLIACKIACNVSQLYQRQTTLSAAYKDLSGHSYAQVGQMMDEMQDFVGDYGKPPSERRRLICPGVGQCTCQNLPVPKANNKTPTRSVLDTECSSNPLMIPRGRRYYSHAPCRFTLLPSLCFLPSKLAHANLPQEGGTKRTAAMNSTAKLTPSVPTTLVGIAAGPPRIPWNIPRSFPYSNRSFCVCYA